MSVQDSVVHIVVTTCVAANVDGWDWSASSTADDEDVESVMSSTNRKSGVG